MTDEQIKMECLKVSAGTLGHRLARGEMVDLVDDAKKLYEFVCGKTVPIKQVA